MTLDDALEALIQNPERLKLALREPGRSQSGLARYLGLDASGVNRLVNGGRELKAREVVQIRGYLEQTARVPVDGGQPKTDDGALATRIRQRLSDLNLTPITAATQRGYPRDLIRNILRQDSNPRADTLVAVASALSTTVGWLLGEAAANGIADRKSTNGAARVIAVRPGGRVTIDIKAEVSVGVATQILNLIEGDEP